MNWYRELYTDKSVKKKRDSIIREIEQGTYRGNLWLITLAVNPENQLELMPVHQLRFPYIRANCPMVIGLASGKKSALALLENIVSEVYGTTGHVNLRSYFLQN